MANPLSDSLSDPSLSVPAWWTRDGVVASFVFGIALVVRLLHFREISLHDPFFTIGSVDGQIYDEWARQLLAGDWLGKGVLYLGPLYPIFIAAVYSVFGEDLPVLKLVQAVLGAATCVLVWGLARELFDRRVAALSGMIAALYGMLIFYGGTVMLVNLQVPLVLACGWSALRALRRPGFARWALCGGILGLSVLARQTVLLIAPIVAAWIVFGAKGPEAFVDDSPGARPSVA